jgi:hypothetical protein
MIVMQRLHVFLDLMSEDKDDLTDLYEGLARLVMVTSHGDVI